MVPECVGYGYCCTEARCTASIYVYGLAGTECRALYWDAHKQMYRCRLVDYAPEYYRTQLCIGRGCCSSLNSWRLNVRERESITDCD